MSLSITIRIDHAMQESSEVSSWISSRLYEATADAPAALREISDVHLAIEGKGFAGEWHIKPPHCSELILMPQSPGLLQLS